MATVERLAVIGTGLIGASAALGARRAGVREVVGWDPDSGHLAIAVERGAVDATAGLVEAVADAEIVVVAAPVGDLPHTVRKAFNSDRRRDARLMLLGWRVVRFTWQQITFEPAYVAATLRGLLTPAT